MGILWAIYSGLRILLAIWTIVFSHMLLPIFANFLPHISSDTGFDVSAFLHVMRGFYILSGIYSLLTGAAGFWASWALLKHEPSGRTIALVVAFVSLLSIPLGTALGVYTLVILLPGDAERTYGRISASA